MKMALLQITNFNPKRVSDGTPLSHHMLNKRTIISGINLVFVYSMGLFARNYYWWLRLKSMNCGFVNPQRHHRLLLCQILIHFKILIRLRFWQFLNFRLAISYIIFRIHFLSVYWGAFAKVVDEIVQLPLHLTLFHWSLRIIWWLFAGEAANSFAFLRFCSLS